MALLSSYMRSGSGWVVTIDDVPEDVQSIFLEKLSTWCDGIPHDWNDPIDDRPFVVTINALVKMVRTAMYAARLTMTVMVQIFDGAAALTIPCSRYYVQQLMTRDPSSQELSASWMIWRIEEGDGDLRHNLVFQSMDMKTIAHELPLLIVADKIQEKFYKEALVEREPAS